MLGVMRLTCCLKVAKRCDVEIMNGKIDAIKIPEPSIIV